MPPVLEFQFVQQVTGEVPPAVNLGLRNTNRAFCGATVLSSFSSLFIVASAVAVSAADTFPAIEIDSDIEITAAMVMYFFIVVRLRYWVTKSLLCKAPHRNPKSARPNEHALIRWARRTDPRSWHDVQLREKCRLFFGVWANANAGRFGACSYRRQARSGLLHQRISGYCWITESAIPRLLTFCVLGRTDRSAT